MPGGSIAVLVVGAGLPWEAQALSTIDAAPGVVVLRRCMDITDLLAHAAAGDAQVALVAGEAPGLDADAIRRLRREGVEPVGVVSEASADAVERLQRIGVRHVLPATAMGDLGAHLRRASHVAGAPAAAAPAAAPGRHAGGGPTSPRDAVRTERSSADEDERPREEGRSDERAAGRPGRTVVVWGPAGAPGRTTVALGFASELATRGFDPLLIDADPWGASVAQRLGVLDEVSGLLAAARLAARGEGRVSLQDVARRVGALRIVSGLPRPDRWHEVGADVVDALVAAGEGFRVLDTGASLEDDSLAEFSGRPGRNALTLTALTGADAVVVVGTPDPIGLARLARGLDDLQAHLAGQPLHVVLNRWRPRLGLDLREARRLLEGFADIASLHVLPDDPLATDRALVTGRTLHESGNGPLTVAFVALVDAVLPDARLGPAAARPGPRRVRRRRAAAGRRP